MAEWEAKITLYRNGRRIYFNDGMGSTPEAALYAAHNDAELWTQDHPESRPEPGDSESGGSR